jgi:hypothetical protein
MSNPTYPVASYPTAVSAATVYPVPAGSPSSAVALDLAASPRTDDLVLAVGHVGALPIPHTPDAAVGPEPVPNVTVPLRVIDTAVRLAVPYVKGEPAVGTLMPFVPAVQTPTVSTPAGVTVGNGTALSTSQGGAALVGGQIVS